MIFSVPWTCQVESMSGRENKFIRFSKEKKQKLILLFMLYKSYNIYIYIYTSSQFTLPANIYFDIIIYINLSVYRFSIYILLSWANLHQNIIASQI